MSASVQPFPFAYFQNRTVPIEQAQLSIMAKVVQYGLGWFGGIRGYVAHNNRYLYIFRLDDHLERFLQSAKILNVTLPYTKAELKKIIIDLTRKNHPKTDTYFRPFAYSDSSELSPNYVHHTEFAFALYMLPLGDYLSTESGNAVCVSSWRRVSDNAIPSRAKIAGAYANSALAKQEAVRNGYVEAIQLAESGEVTEGTAMNVFMVRNGVLITPSVSSDILEGITRRTIFELAQHLGIPVKERSVDRSELYVADELFFAGTGAQIAWIDSVDHRRVGTGTIGPITKQIRDLFLSVVRGKEAKFKKWLTPLPLV